MRGYKREFIELALELGVLRFGEFTLKSGRVSPYFFNAGLFNTGYAAAKLGRYYAAAIAEYPRSHCFSGSARNCCQSSAPLVGM